MHLVTLEGVSKRYAELELLREADLIVREGDRIGLIGVNGSGKSTLLKIISGEEDLDSGSLVIQKGKRIQYLPQDDRLNDEYTVLQQVFDSESPRVRLLKEYDETSLKLHASPADVELQQKLSQLSAEMERTGSWAAEASAKSILTKLGIDQFDKKIAELSGGQRKRVALARALIDPADLLILDEPTNHIDAETIAWLEDYLVTVPGAIIMVTHDRYFLDRITTSIIELENCKLESYSGSYNLYLEQKDDRQRLAQERETTRQNLLRKELDWLRRFPKARSTKPKARIQRVEEMLAATPPGKQRNVTIAIAGKRLGKEVLEAQGLSKSFGSLNLFQDIDFILKPGTRVGIVGPNGAGKSTFLNILAERMEADSGSIKWGKTVSLGYYDQQSQGLVEEMRLLDYIDSIAPNILRDDGYLIDAARMLEWFLFPRGQQRTTINKLSGGERRRLYLLGVLARQPNVLFLDEPTNDLDIQTLGVLEEFLDHFKGCLVTVSHDRYFLDRNVDFICNFENGKVSQNYPGPFDNYLRIKNEEKEPEKKLESRSSTKPKSSSPGKKLTRRQEEELTRLEALIEELEGQKTGLQNEMALSGSDFEKLNQLSSEEAKLDLHLEAAMAEWEALSQLLE